MDETRFDELIGKVEGTPSPEEIDSLFEETPTEDAGKATEENPAKDATDPPEGGTKGAENPGTATDTPVDPENPDPAHAVIKSKNGVYTIEYEKLVEARDAAKTWREEAESTKAQLEALKRQVAEKSVTPTPPADTGSQTPDAETLPDKFFGDFSEKELAAGVEKLVAARIEREIAQRLEPLKQAIAPIAEKQARAEHSAHEQAIYAKHEDADSIVESKEFSDWLRAQPSFTQQAVVQVLRGGSTTEVIELFDTFKASLPPPPEGSEQAIRAAASAAIAKAAAAPPVSLTDLSGGKPGATGTKIERLRELNDGVAMLDALDGESPEKIEEYLRQL